MKNVLCSHHVPAPAADYLADKELSYTIPVIDAVDVFFENDAEEYGVQDEQRVVSPIPPLVRESLVVESVPSLLEAAHEVVQPHVGTPEAGQLVAHSRFVANNTRSRVVQRTFDRQGFRATKYTCQHCDDCRDVSCDVLRNHVRSRHPEKALFACARCEAPFNRASEFRAHVRDEACLDQSNPYLRAKPRGGTKRRQNDSQQARDDNRQARTTKKLRSAH
jgi:uncharacterized C2H2 Zn-finger protein